MMGTLIQKVSDIENKYTELKSRAKVSDSVCQIDESMNITPGRDEEDEIDDCLSSVSARGQEKQTPHVDMVGTDEQSDGCAGGDNKNTNKESDPVSDSEFCVTVKWQDEDVFSLLEADLKTQEQAGKPVVKKLAKVTRNLFSVKLPNKN